MISLSVLVSGTPQPFNKIAKIVIMIIAVLFVINALLMLAGQTPIVRLH